MRRSTVMLAPHSPAGLDRDTAMTVLAELQDLCRKRVQQRRVHPPGRRVDVAGWFPAG